MRGNVEVVVHPITCVRVRYMLKVNPLFLRRMVDFFRSWGLFRHFRNYFPVRLHKTADLSPDRTYLFCSHPHGILCFGAFSSFATSHSGFEKLFPGLYPRILTLKQQFWLPGCRELISGAGLCSASKRGMQALLR